MGTKKQFPESIEIFRPGTHTDGDGNTITFSAGDIAGMASSYDPALHEAPLCVGHPADNLPAYGWVAGLSVNARGGLDMRARDVEPQFSDMVVGRRFPKRSIALYNPAHPNNPAPGKWYVRHVAFLGAQPPAVRGLREFAADEPGIVCFSEGADAAPDASSPPTVVDPPPKKEPSAMDKDLQERLAAAEKQLQAEREKTAAAEAKAKAAEEGKTAAEKQAAEFAEQRQKERRAAISSFCEEQVQAARLPKKDLAAAVAALEALADARPVQFSEGDATRTVSPFDWLKGYMQTRTALVQFGEFAPASGAEQVETLTDDELHKRALAYRAKHKDATYGEALVAVTAFQTEA